jgi:hypothetical protein
MEMKKIFSYSKNGRAAKNLIQKWPRSEKFDPKMAAQRKKFD